MPTWRRSPRPAVASVRASCRRWCWRGCWSPGPAPTSTVEPSLARLREREPDAYAFAVHGFVGATPELLVARRGRSVVSNPLAGTVARAADPSEDRAAAERLLASRKDLLEHAPVVDAVRDALAPVCDELSVDASPALLGTGTVWHLSTSVRGTLRGPAPSALELAARLHPTPAVCGTPRDAAMAAIGRLEAIDRTLYGGIVGWMDADGDGEWAVVLRCAEIQGRIALLFAGAGIVADPSGRRAGRDGREVPFDARRPRLRAPRAAATLGIAVRREGRSRRRTDLGPRAHAEPPVDRHLEHVDPSGRRRPTDRRGRSTGPSIVRGPPSRTELADIDACVEQPLVLQGSPRDGQDPPSAVFGTTITAPPVPLPIANARAAAGPQQGAGVVEQAGPRSRRMSAWEVPPKRSRRS